MNSFTSAIPMACIKIREWRGSYEILRERNQLLQTLQLLFLRLCVGQPPKSEGITVFAWRISCLRVICWKI